MSAGATWVEPAPRAASAGALPRAFGGAWRILRPANCAIASAGVLVGAYVAAGPQGLGSAAVLGAAAAFLASAFGNVLNDLADVAVDKIAHPTRPLPRGDVTENAARSVAAASALLAFGIGFAISVPAGLFVGGSLVVMAVYEAALKSRGLPGNLAVAALTGAPFVFGGLVALAAPSAVSLAPVLVLAVLAALVNVGREVLKDVEDMAADVGRNTLPQRAGRAVARKVAAAALLLGVALSPLPYLRGDAGWGYLPLVLVADALFVASAFAPRAGRAQRLAKAGMLAALVAFVAGTATAGAIPW